MSLEQKSSHGDIEIYTDICFQSASRMQFMGINKSKSTNVFLTPNRNMLAGKFVKPERFLAVLQEHIAFNAK